MMDSKYPLSYVPLTQGENKRSEGRVGCWIESWWKDEEGEQPWGGQPLTEVTKDKNFRLHQLDGTRMDATTSGDGNGGGRVQQG